jgi:hypothetical protein
MKTETAYAGRWAVFSFSPSPYVQLAVIAGSRFAAQQTCPAQKVNILCRLFGRKVCRQRFTLVI